MLDKKNKYENHKNIEIYLVKINYLKILQN